MDLATTQEPKAPTVADHKRELPNDLRWNHAAASALHGWNEHEYHSGSVLELSAEDYAKALEAAAKPGTKGIYVPHLPAVAPHKKDEAEKVAKAEAEKATDSKRRAR